MPVPQQHKNLCLSALTARMEALDPSNEEYKECSFLVKALSNGWLVSDIEMLRAVYYTVQNVPEGEFRPSGEKILGQFASQKMNTLSDRFEMMELTNRYLAQLSFQHGEFKQARILASNQHNKGIVFPSEYPEDQEFGKTAGKESVEEGISFGEISRNPARYNELKRRWEARARTNSVYVFDQRSDGEREAERQKPFVPHSAQRFNDITKTTVQAASEVVGEGVYDEIDEMRRGSYADRKVTLHHATGTKFMQQGHDVLEMEFAGSGGKDVFKPYKNHTGGIDEKRFPSMQEADEFYGKKAKMPDGSEDKYIRYKESSRMLPDGSTANKTHYTIAGATPDLWKISGLLNVGAYSIENCREYGRYFAEQFLKPRFERWLKGETPKPVHIELYGHSRGAVSAGQAAKKIDAWITKFIQAHQPQAEEFKKYIHYDLQLRDPVPGMITDLHLGSCTLRDIPNMNATVFCSLGIQAPDLAFPLQHVKGAKKLILTTDTHQMDLLEEDESQQSVLGAGKKHASAYYDAETGEMHRGSGLNELPDGIYVADEKRNLIRLTSYNQVNDLFGAVYDKSSPQRIRARRIHEMVRDWFVENHLEMSFPDERTRKAETAKNDVIQSKILRSGGKRMEPVKAELEKLRELKQKNPSKEELIEQHKKLIEACRTYMKETKPMPPSGNSAYKLGLIGDTLSFTMRENNQLTKELSIERGEHRVFELDDKIRAQKDRLEKKEGYLERKQAAEAKRLEQEKKVLDLIGKTSKRCKDSLTKLDNTRVGKSGSESYEQLHKVLEVGAKLGSQTSVRDMTEFLRLFNEASEGYSRGHNALLGPFTDDGIKRLEESQTLNKFGKQTSETLKELSKDLGDKHTPIGLRIKNRSEDLEYLKNKQAELKGPEKQPEIKAAEQSAPFVLS